MKNSKQNQKYCLTELVILAKCGFDSLVIYESFLFMNIITKRSQKKKMTNAKYVLLYNNGKFSVCQKYFKSLGAFKNNTTTNFSSS